MNDGKMYGGFVSGLIAGAVLGVLFAPKKGSETRQDVQREAKKAYDTASVRLRRVEKSANKTVNDIAKQVDKLVERINKGDEPAKSDLEKYLDELDEAAKRIGL